MLGNRDDRHGNGNCRTQRLGKFGGRKQVGARAPRGRQGDRDDLECKAGSGPTGLRMKGPGKRGVLLLSPL